MPCCDPCTGSPEDTVGQCPNCDGDVDKDGQTTEETCFYSPIDCKTCMSQTCDQSC